MRVQIRLLMQRVLRDNLHQTMKVIAALAIKSNGCLECCLVRILIIKNPSGY